MSKWTNTNSPAYWNKLLKEEGLATVKGRQVIGPRRGESRRHYLKRMADAEEHRKYLERVKRRQEREAQAS